MDLEELGKTVGATTVVGGGVVWTLREKIAAWVKGLMERRFEKAEQRIDGLEQMQTTHQGEMMRLTESVERTSETVTESIRRLTLAVERIADKHEETGKAVARIEGAVARDRGER